MADANSENGDAPTSSSSGGGSACKVFLRVRPSKRPSGFFSLDMGPSGNGLVEFNLPADVDRELVHNSRSGSHKYTFDGHFDMRCSQDAVFDEVAKEAVDSALNGFNATVFAYGQTGSGKTFTITGGAERYQDRGLIPRSIQRVFSQVKERTGEKFLAYISYLEIYNEQGYDLLDPSNESRSLEELPRVSLMEDEDGNVHLKGLSMHLVQSEEEALNLLFLGDTNRAIAETPMNMASSRSHCIFTISLESREEGSSSVRRSKFHLVDLAGSERVHKTNASGQLFKEATYINKSLHYLELVIVALHEMRRGQRTHIPYRNSIMTSVLRDSLGGNCKTTMIATINPEMEHTNESISTCRFAQRVARVQNSAIVNEETDPKILIQQLKNKMSALEQEVAYYKKDEEGGSGAAALTEREVQAINASAKAWIEGPDGAPFTFGSGAMNLERIKAAFLALRMTALEYKQVGRNTAANNFNNKSASDIQSSPSKKQAAGSDQDSETKNDSSSSSSSSSSGPLSTGESVLREEIKRLKSQVQQRDNELALLVQTVKALRAAAGGGGGGSAPSSDGNNAPPTLASAPAAVVPLGITLENGQFATPEMLSDRDRAFDLFKSSYSKLSAIEDNKILLKQRYDEAKQTAELVNSARGETNRLKAEIERGRVETAMTNLVTANTSGAMSVDSKSADGSSDSSQSNISSASSSVTMMSFSDEPRLRAELDHHKAVYKEAFQRLRDLKAEIEKIQRVLEGGRLKMQSDFEAWYSDCLMKLSKLTQNETQKLVNRGASTQPSLNSSAPSSTGSGGAASTTQGVMMAMPPPQGMMMPNMLMPPMMGGHMLPPTFSQGNMMMNGPPPPNMQMPMGMMMMPPQGLPPGFPPNMMMPLGFQQPMPLPLGAATRQAKQPSSSSSSSSSSANTSFESTGSDSADADIQAFYKAKQLLAGAMGGGGLAQPPHTR